MRIDLHTHSTASDGTDTPAELVRNAAAAGLDVVALTDHDTVARARRGRSPRCPPGSPWSPAPSCPAGSTASSLHMLAYLFDPDEPELLARARAGTGRPGAAGPGMVAKLQRAGRARHLGAGRADRRRRLGRAAAHRHRAGRAGRRARPSRDAFTQEWLADGGRAYVEKHETRPLRGAPAGQGRRRGRRLRAPAGRQARPVRAGVRDRRAGRGRSRRHRGRPHGPRRADTRARLRGLAADLGLLATGSSDYHGSRKTCRARRVHDRPRGVRRDHRAAATGAFPVPGGRRTPASRRSPHPLSPARSPARPSSAARARPSKASSACSTSPSSAPSSSPSSSSWIPPGSPRSSSP